jgi:protein gp37
MAENSQIEWTDGTWNPIAGCSPMSEGCRNCYAAKEAIRLGGNQHPAISGKYAGTSEMRGAGRQRRAVFTGNITFDELALQKPLGWRKPRRVFVNSMSDLFHEAVPVEFIARVWDIMARSPQHTFQILTKRPERMATLLARFRSWEGWITHNGAPPKGYWTERNGPEPGLIVGEEGRWPLPNVWLGTSVEDQMSADKRIPHLLRTPAAVRFLSCEPLLAPVDLSATLRRCTCEHAEYEHDPFDGPCEECLCTIPEWETAIQWVIVGGESGPGARGFNLRWARTIVAQCREAGVAPFVKQLGGKPYSIETKREFIGTRLMLWGTREQASLLELRDKKGGDPDEWPDDLRVREFPAVQS